MRHTLVTAVALVAFAATSDAQAAPPRKQLVEELRLDANTEDFPSIGTLHVGPHGQIVVPINDDQQLRFYDAQGKKIGVFGRKGSGPGEFRRMVRFGWLADTLWVYDVDLRRLTYVSPSAKLVRSEVVDPHLNEGMTGGRGRGGPQQGAIYMFSPAAISTDGVLTGGASITVGMNAKKVVDTRQVVIATTADGTKRRNVATPPKTDDAGVGYYPGDGTAFYASIPFTFYPRTDYAADGTRLAFLTADVPSGASYSVTALRLSLKRNQLALQESGRSDVVDRGDTIFSRTYSVAPVAIPSSVMDSAISAIGGGTGSRGAPMFPPAVADKLRDLVRAKAPPAYAPVSGLVIGLDNTTWVILRKTADGTPVVALDAKGKPTASILIPLKSRLAQASLDRIWVLETDDDGLSSVVRYRLK